MLRPTDLCALKNFEFVANIKFEVLVSLEYLAILDFSFYKATIDWSCIAAAFFRSNSFVHLATFNPSLYHLLTCRPKVCWHLSSPFSCCFSYTWISELIYIICQTLLVQFAILSLQRKTWQSFYKIRFRIFPPLVLLLINSLD